MVQCFRPGIPRTSINLIPVLLLLAAGMCAGVGWTGSMERLRIAGNPQKKTKGIGVEGYKIEAE